MGTNIGPIFEMPADAGPRPGAPEGGDATKVPGLITWISKNPHLPGQPDNYPNINYHKTLVWVLPGRAIKGSIDEDKQGNLKFEGEFRTKDHPNGTTTLNDKEKDEIVALLNQEKPAVNKLDDDRYGETRKNFLEDLELAKKETPHKKRGTCAVTIEGPDHICKGDFGKFTAIGLPRGGSYSWAPTIHQDLDGLYGVQQAVQRRKAETTLRADSDSGTSHIGVAYRVGKCQAKNSKAVQLCKNP